MNLSGVWVCGQQRKQKWKCSNAVNCKSTITTLQLTEAAGLIQDITLKSTYDL